MNSNMKIYWKWLLLPLEKCTHKNQQIFYEHFDNIWRLLRDSSKENLTVFGSDLVNTRDVPDLKLTLPRTQKNSAPENL